MNDTQVAERVAKILVELSPNLTRHEFSKVLEHLLLDRSTTDVALIASFLPTDLQMLLPRKCLH